MQLKFIHTADWQLGKKFLNFEDEEIITNLRQKRFATVKKIAELATKYQVNAVLVAGDVFDSNDLSNKILRQALNAMQDYNGKWILLPGNHDPATNNSVWHRIVDLSEKTQNIICATKQEVLEFDNWQLLVAPLQQKYAAHDLTQYFTSHIKKDKFMIALAHGSIDSFTLNQNNIIKLENLQHLDYVALGDWHGMKQINDKIFYSGTPEADRFPKTAQQLGQVLLVTLETNKLPKVKNLKTGYFDWHNLNYEIFNKQNILTLNSNLSKYEPQEKQIIKLTVTGSLSLCLQNELHEVLEKWQAKFAMLQVKNNIINILNKNTDFTNINDFNKQLLLNLENISKNPQHPQQLIAQQAIQLLWHTINKN